MFWFSFFQVLSKALPAIFTAVEVIVECIKEANRHPSLIADNKVLAAKQQLKGLIYLNQVFDVEMKEKIVDLINKAVTLHDLRIVSEEVSKMTNKYVTAFTRVSYKNMFTLEIEEKICDETIKLVDELKANNLIVKKNDLRYNHADEESYMEYSGHDLSAIAISKVVRVMTKLINSQSRRPIFKADGSKEKDSECYLGVWFTLITLCRYDPKKENVDSMSQHMVFEDYAGCTFLEFDQIVNMVAESIEQLTDSEVKIMAPTDADFLQKIWQDSIKYHQDIFVNLLVMQRDVITKLATQLLDGKNKSRQLDNIVLHGEGKTSGLSVKAKDQHQQFEELESIVSYDNEDLPEQYHQYYSKHWKYKRFD